MSETGGSAIRPDSSLHPEEVPIVIPGAPQPPNTPEHSRDHFVPNAEKVFGTEILREQDRLAIRDELFALAKKARGENGQPGSLDSAKELARRLAELRRSGLKVTVGIDRIKNILQPHREAMRQQNSPLEYARFLGQLQFTGLLDELTNEDRVQLEAGARFALNQNKPDTLSRQLMWNKYLMKTAPLIEGAPKMLQDDFATTVSGGKNPLVMARNEARLKFLGIPTGFSSDGTARLHAKIDSFIARAGAKATAGSKEAWPIFARLGNLAQYVRGPRAIHNVAWQESCAQHVLATRDQATTSGTWKAFSNFYADAATLSRASVPTTSPVSIASEPAPTAIPTQELPPDLYTQTLAGFETTSLTNSVTTEIPQMPETNEDAFTDHVMQILGEPPANPTPATAESPTAGQPERVAEKIPGDLADALHRPSQQLTDEQIAADLQADHLNAVRESGVELDQLTPEEVAAIKNSRVAAATTERKQRQEQRRQQQETPPQELTDEQVLAWLSDGQNRDRLMRTAKAGTDLTTLSEADLNRDDAQDDYVKQMFDRIAAAGLELDNLAPELQRALEKRQAELILEDQVEEFLRKSERGDNQSFQQSTDVMQPAPPSPKSTHTSTAETSDQPTATEAAPQAVESLVYEQQAPTPVRYRMTFEKMDELTRGALRNDLEEFFPRVNDKKKQTRQIWSAYEDIKEYRQQHEKSSYRKWLQDPSNQSLITALRKAGFRTTQAWKIVEADLA